MWNIARGKEASWNNRLQKRKQLSLKLDSHNSEVQCIRLPTTARKRSDNAYMKERKAAAASFSWKTRSHTYDARLAMVIACDITCSAEQGGHAKKLLAISSHRLHLLSIIFLCHSPLLRGTGTSIFAAERNTGVAFQIKAPTSFYCQSGEARNISTKLSDDKHQVLTYSRRHL